MFKGLFKGAAQLAAQVASKQQASLTSDADLYTFWLGCVLM